MPVPFHVMRSFENQRVHMRFDDGLETIATLHSAVEDLDGSQHLIYNQVEWSTSQVELDSKEETFYAEGDSLLAIQPAPPPAATIS